MSEQRLAMCAMHEMRYGRPNPRCPACRGELHTHNGERSDVRLAARSKMAEEAGR